MTPRTAPWSDVLTSRGARHHTFSAIAMSLGDEVRRIWSRRTPVRSPSRGVATRTSSARPLRGPNGISRQWSRSSSTSGADPLAVDGSGFSAAAYATSPHVDRRVMEAIAAMTSAELTSAVRGDRRPRGRRGDLMAALALGDRETAARLLREIPELIQAGGPSGGALHLMGKRNDVRRGGMAARPRRRSQRALEPLGRGGDPAPSCRPGRSSQTSCGSC